MNLTEIVIAFVIVVALLWDIWLYADKHPDNSISQVIIKRSKELPFIPFLVGLLVGHLYA